MKNKRQEAVIISNCIEQQKAQLNKAIYDFILKFNCTHQVRDHVENIMKWRCHSMDNVMAKYTTQEATRSLMESLE